MPAPKDPEKRGEWIRKNREAHQNKHPSEATLKKMSKSHMGIEPWNKGVSSSEETCKKQSEALKNKPKPPRSKEHCKKISNRMSTTTLGENNNRWKGGITPFLKTLRMLPKMYEWRSKVMERDDYRDCFTGIRGNGDLEVHHIVPFSKLLKNIILKQWKMLSHAKNCGILITV